MNNRYIDLTHVFDNKMPCYPGDKTPSLKQVTFFEKQGFNIFEVNSSMHVGTHMDAPLHFIKDGKRLSDYPMERFFVKTHLIRVHGIATIEEEAIKGLKIAEGEAVVFETGFSKQFKHKEYYTSYPSISNRLAEALSDLKIGMLGLDTPSPDYPPCEVHKILLGNDVLILENLTNLERIATSYFEMIALPLRFEAEAAPARVVAKI